MKRSYSGGCHCGAVRFEAEIDASLGTDKCNCSICMKTRLWSFEVAPADMRITRRDGLADYTYGSHVAHHYFCRVCGIRPFEFVDLPEQQRAYYNVQVVCVDGLDIDELMAAPIRLQDGLHDRWDRVPDETRLL